MITGNWGDLVDDEEREDDTELKTEVEQVPLPARTPIFLFADPIDGPPQFKDVKKTKKALWEHVDSKRIKAWHAYFPEVGEVLYDSGRRAKATEEFVQARQRLVPPSEWRKYTQPWTRTSSSSTGC
jgi:hypothetical protein